MHSIRSIALISVLAFFSAPVLAKVPECSEADAWGPTMSFVRLKNAGITNNDKVDFSKTKVVLLASEKIGKDLYRIVNDVVFTEKSGGKIEVIAINDASSEECSMSGVEVFVVSRRFGGLDG